MQKTRGEVTELSEKTQAECELQRRVLGAASSLFCDRGIKNVRMDDIAAEMGISKRTLYEVYDKKETLLKAVMERYHATYAKAWEQLSRGRENVIELIFLKMKMFTAAMKAINPVFFADLKHYPRLHRHSKEEEDRMRKDNMDFLQKGQEQGLFRRDVNHEIFYSLMGAQMHFLFQEAARRNLDMTEVQEAIIITTIRGISTLKGYELLERFLQDYRSGQEEEIRQLRKLLEEVDA